MNAREFFFLTSRVREAQKQYFQTRAQQDLRLCKVLESELDIEIRRVKEILQTIPTETSYTP